jgi:hypothetical protein
MRYVLVLLVISLISFNANAKGTDDTVTDMMTGDYGCLPGEREPGTGQKIDITAATHIEVSEIQPHFFDPYPRCVTFFQEITTLLQLYNCITHEHPELAGRDLLLNFVCRGTREEMVNLTADIYEHLHHSYPH